MLLNTVIKSQLYSFYIVTLLLIAIVALFFLKQPKLLGKDIHALRNEIMKVFDKRKNKKQEKVLTQAENAKVEEIFEEDDLL